METGEDPQQHTGHEGLPGVGPAVATDSVQDTVKLALQHLANSSSGSSSSTSSSRSSAPTTTTRSSSPLTLAVTTSSSSSAVARNQQLVARAARQLHRVSPSWQAAARGTITHLNRDAYRVGCLRACPPPAEGNTTAGPSGSIAGQGTPPQAGQVSSTATDSGPLPLDLLSAVPALRSLVIHTSQVPGLLSSLGGTFSSIAARLTGLEVEVEDCRSHFGEAVQLPGSVLQLPALLSCCTGLRQLRLWGRRQFECDEAQLPPGVADSILQLPLWRLELMDVALGPEADATTTTTTTTSSSGASCSSSSSSSSSGGGSDSSSRHVGVTTSLPLLRGLQELTVRRGGSYLAPVVSPALLPQLRQLTSLTWDLIDSDRPPVALEQLTGLRHLEVRAEGRLWRGMGWTGLSALTSLYLVNDYFDDNPPSGISLPHLVALRVDTCLPYAALPVGLTALTSLEVQISVQGGAMKQLQKLTRLRQLSLYLECDADLADGLSTLTGLEVLCLEGRYGDERWHGWPQAQLGALSRLRSLRLWGGDGDGLAATVASATACLQLTQLQLGCHTVASISDAETNRLLQLGGLAHLRDLTIMAHVYPRPLWAWLGQHTSLTRLQLDYDSFDGETAAAAAAAAAALGQLPTTLQTLFLCGSRLPELPASLSRLVNLQGLDLRPWVYVTQLPSWCSQLQRLEWIRLGCGVRTPQPVLGQLPALRYVAMAPPVSRAVAVLAYVPHLCWYPYCSKWFGRFSSDRRDPIRDEDV